MQAHRFPRKGRGHTLVTNSHNVLNTIRNWVRSPLVRKYTRNTGWLLSTRLAWVTSAFTVGIYVARSLGPLRFGLLNYAISMAVMFSVIATMNVEEVVIRQLVRYPTRRDRILGNFFILRLYLFLIMGIALGTSLYHFGVASETRTLCLIVSLGYSGILMQGCALYFQSTVEAKYASLPQLLACLINTVVRFSAAYFQWPLAVFAAAEAGNVFLYYFGCGWYYWRRVDSPLKWTASQREVMALFRVALPLAICSIFNIVYARTDQLMVGHFLGSSAVGHYALATRFIENWGLAANLLCISFFPAVISAATVSRGAYHKQLHRLYFLVFWGMAAAAAATSLLSRQVIRLLFGEAYLPTVHVLNVYSWTLLCTALLNVFAQWAINERRLNMIALSFTTGAVLNVLLNPLLIHSFGFTGSAWSSLISMPIGLLLTLILTPSGRSHLRLMGQSVFTWPSFRLGEHDGQGQAPASRPEA